MLRMMLIVLLAVALGGCEPEETYKGKPLSDWLKLAKDNDADTRAGAMLALGEMKSDSARRVIHDAALNDFSTPVRLAAMKGARLSDEETLATLNWLVDQDLDVGFAYGVTKDPFIYAVEGLGPKAAPIAKKLAELRKKRVDATDAELIDRMIAATTTRPAL